MQTNILEYLEHTVSRFPDKTAFADEEHSLTFQECMHQAKQIGSVLAGLGADTEPVIIYMERSPFLLASFLGVIYGGCFYVPIDDEMPKRRMELICKNINARFIIYDAKTEEKAKKLYEKQNTSVCLLSYESCLEGEVSEPVLSEIRTQAVDADPVCIFYTSGSTGMPKGVVTSHRSVINYVEQLTSVLNIDETSVMANQTPLYWDASMKDIYASLKYGATTYIVPKNLFMMPVKLVEYLNKYKINTLNWVVSALTMISGFGTFDIIKPEYLRLVTFCGEPFPVKHFNIWKEQLPDVEFYNLYGPTEATGVSTYYHANRIFHETETIPIGKPFCNRQILLLNKEGKEIADGEVGEICIRGSGLALGYFNDTERTKQVFTQNPANTLYRDLVYHTGDLARKNEDGDYIFQSRKDHQIKHMGHRIELGEIEANVSMIDEIRSCCSVYVREKNKIVLFYTGEIEKPELTKKMREYIPNYMMPNAIMRLDQLPLCPNGKMDRIGMQKIFMDMEGRHGKRKH